MGKPVKNEENYKFEINNLNLHYGDFHALKNINMNIEKNQITAFIGPSGCGKSTFLKTLNRMNDLVDGVKIDGNTIDAKNYTAKEGSTIITLTTDYLKTLSIGTHTFEIVWTDGSASTNFTVSKNDSGSETPKDDDKNKNDDSGSQTGDNHHITAPQTGDNSHLTLWISLLGASLIGLLATLYMRKKKDNE